MTENDYGGTAVARRGRGPARVGCVDRGYSEPDPPEGCRPPAKTAGRFESPTTPNSVGSRARRPPRETRAASKCRSPFTRRRSVFVRPRPKDRGLSERRCTARQLREAKKAFARVVRLQPKHSGRIGFKGLCEFQLKEYDRALDDLMHATDLGVTEPKDIMAAAIAYHTAITMTRLKQYKFALGTLQNFARDGNDSPRVIEALGMALLRIPMIPSELPPDRRELVMLAGRAAAYRAARKPAAARACLRAARPALPDTPNIITARRLPAERGARSRRRGVQAGTQDLRRPSPVNPADCVREYLRRSDWESAKGWARGPLTWLPRLHGKARDRPGAARDGEYS